MTLEFQSLCPKSSKKKTEPYLCKKMINKDIIWFRFELINIKSVISAHFARKKDSGHVFVLTVKLFVVFQTVTIYRGLSIIAVAIFIDVILAASQSGRKLLIKTMKGNQFYFLKLQRYVLTTVKPGTLSNRVIKYHLGPSCSQ